MGMVSSLCSSKKKIDEATSNTSLSNMRYVAVEKPKWKVFAKKEIRPIPVHPLVPKGCPCGNIGGPCKQKVTPNGVTIHYPKKKKKKFSSFSKEKRYKPPNVDKGYLNNKDREPKPVKIVRPKKFPIPTWRVDKVLYDSPFDAKKDREPKNVKRVRPKKFAIWRVDKILYDSPFNAKTNDLQNSSRMTSQLIQPPCDDPDVGNSRKRKMMSLTNIVEPKLQK